MERRFRHKMKLWGVCLLVMFVSLSCAKAKSAILSEKAFRQHNEGNYDKAIVTYKRLIALDPKNAINYWDLAVAYIDKGDSKSAKLQVEQLRQLGENELANQLDFLVRKSGQAVMYTGRYLPSE